MSTMKDPDNHEHLEAEWLQSIEASWDEILKILCGDDEED